MKAQGLVWLGVRTAETDAMAAFFTIVMRFPLAEKAHDFVRFQLPNRDQIELFGPTVNPAFALFVRQGNRATSFGCACKRDWSNFGNFSEMRLIAASPDSILVRSSSYG